MYTFITATSASSYVLVKRLCIVSLSDLAFRIAQRSRESIQSI